MNENGKTHLQIKTFTNQILSILELNINFNLLMENISVELSTIY